MIAAEDAIEQRKRRAIEFLTSRRLEVKRPDQFTISEISKLMNRKDTSSLYVYMDELVTKGLWETGYALDPRTNRKTKVWWVKDT